MLNISVGTYQESFRLCKTTAPAEYDYAYCIAVYDNTLPDERYVLIPNSNYAYQTGRYLSGTHMVEEIEIDVNLLAWLTERLVSRLRGM